MNSGRIITADEGQPPFQGQHNRQNGDGLDDVGDNVDDGVGDGILSADHIIVQAAHQLAHFGVGEKAQRHALQAGEESNAQIVDHAFTHLGVQAALEHVDQPAGSRDRQKGQGQPDELVDPPLRDRLVDQLAQDQGRQQGQAGGGQNHDQHGSDLPAVGLGILHDPLEQLPGYFRFFIP